MKLSFLIFKYYRLPLFTLRTQVLSKQMQGDLGPRIKINFMCDKFSNGHKEFTVEKEILTQLPFFAEKFESGLLDENATNEIMVDNEYVTENCKSYSGLIL